MESGVVSVVATCQREVGHVESITESEVVSVVVTCQRVQTGWLKLDWDVWWSRIALCLSNLREARMFSRLLMSPQLWGVLGADAAGGSHLL